MPTCIISLKHGFIITMTTTHRITILMHMEHLQKMESTSTSILGFLLNHQIASLRLWWCLAHHV